ncbi:MAG: 3-hydroxyacyl-CoA dehydrogenase NAD-binding domain-containing protein [Nitrososphaeria archaeon]
MTKVAVIGAGTMGHGIAQLAAIAGYSVVLNDISKELLNNAIKKIEWSLNKIKESGRLSEEVEAVMSRLTAAVSVDEALNGASVVFEAVPERLDLKLDVFRKADRLAANDSLLATNTSSIPISEIASSLTRPERVIGMHFFNPPQLMPLIEIVRGQKTADDYVKTALDISKKFGKEAVIVNRDVPGFIVNRVLARLMNTACVVVSHGKATVEAVDSALKYRLGFPMGAFELADYSGIDVFYFVFKAMKERGFKMHDCGLFEEKFNNKELGIKTGRGFYSYPEPGKYHRANISREAGERLDISELVAPAVNEAIWLVREGVSEPQDINKATKLGLGYPRGILEIGNEIGMPEVMHALTRLRELTSWDEYEADTLLQEIVLSGSKYF